MKPISTATAMERSAATPPAALPDAPTTATPPHISTATAMERPAATPPAALPEAPTTATPPHISTATAMERSAAAPPAALPEAAIAPTPPHISTATAMERSAAASAPTLPGAATHATPRPTQPTRRVALPLTAILTTLALLLAACGSAKPAPPPRPTATPTIAATAPTGTRTITDQAGRSVSLPDTVDTVVAISPSALDFATALGLTVIGRPSDTTASSAPVVGSTLSPDFTAIAALHPELVIADAAYDGSRLRDFDSFPYPVFVLKAGSYAEVLATLVALGDATGHADRAATAAADIKNRVDAVVAKASTAAPKPSVLIVTGAGRDIYGGSDSSYTGALTKLLGANNLLGTLPVGAPIAGFGTVDLGQLATRNPDIVLAIPTANGTLAADIRASAAWANTNAVKHSKVFELDSATYLRSPGPHVAEAVEHLYQLLYQ